MNFEQAAAGSADRFFSTFGVPVTVRRGENVLALTAIASWRQYAGETEAGTIVQAKVRDYRFRAADLVLGGVAFLPAAGDRIELTGTFGSYEELDETYYYIQADSIRTME